MTHIYPVARYDDAPAAIEFLQRAFGFATRAVFEGPGGTVAHAELTFGNGAVGLSSAGPVDPANVWTTVRDGVYAAIDDVDAHHARAVAAGAPIERPLKDTDYGSREYTARDPEGRLWSFGTYAMSEGEGPATFIPELRYADPRAALTFLEASFGLQPGLVVPDGGGIAHAELWLGDAVLMVSGNGHPDNWGDQRQCTQVFVADPDAHAAQAQAAGATIVRPVADASYGARGYLATDPEGFLWGFSNYRPKQ